MKIGEAIQSIRLQRKMSLKTLAIRSGCSISHLSLVETHHRNVSLKVLQTIAGVLEIPTTLLIALTEPEMKEISEILLSRYQLTSGQYIQHSLFEGGIL